MAGILVKKFYQSARNHLAGQRYHRRSQGLIWERRRASERGVYLRGKAGRLKGFRLKGESVGRAGGCRPARLRSCATPGGPIRRQCRARETGQKRGLEAWGAAKAVLHPPSRRRCK